MSHCHTTLDDPQLRDSSIALVGHPNVGKSALFQRLTGQHVIISNYPGTTLEVMRGRARRLPDVMVIDTPGVIALPPHTEDEMVTAHLLLNEPLKGVLQVGDAKNLRRTLLLTVQLAEMGVPLVLALNMMDEAEAHGISLDHQRLAQALGIPVIPTTAVRGLGVNAVVSALADPRPATLHLDYPPEIESAIAQLTSLLEGQDLQRAIAPRALALLLLGGDSLSETWLREHLDPHTCANLLDLRDALLTRFHKAPSNLIQRARMQAVESIASSAVAQAGISRLGISERLGHLAVHPFFGLIILGAVLYAVYWFVGVFGAGVLVELLEVRLFGEIINPALTALLERLLPFPLLLDLLVGEFGLWTMGITYALALILPIVATFFLAFGILEDSGYLPRLAALTNRMFSTLGLNGKAVLPMVLGLGCVTMATLTARILDSKRDRLLVTLFLALAVPCSAQLGVVMGMLAGVSFGATLIWSAVVLLVLLLVGWLAARLLPGERTQLLLELPPLRLPQASNVLVKTLARMEWYIKEVIPLFLLGALIMFILDQTGILAWLVRLSDPLVSGWLGLPAEASAAFIMGFLRRDFGATGLFVMQSQGMLTPVQVVVAMVTITLFVPCIASVMMIAKERGWRVATAIVLAVIPLAFLVSGLLYRFLSWVGWGL